MLMRSVDISLSLKSIRLRTSLGLGSPVLEPNLDLGVCQLQVLSHLLPLLHAEVGPLLVLVLQLGQLVRGERCPWLPVWSVFAKRTFQWRNGTGKLGWKLLEQEWICGELEMKQGIEEWILGWKNWNWNERGRSLDPVR